MQNKRSLGPVVFDHFDSAALRGSLNQGFTVLKPYVTIKPLLLQQVSQMPRHRISDAQRMDCDRVGTSASARVPMTGWKALGVTDPSIGIARREVKFCDPRKTS
jgi:hypothetical protein